MLWVTGLLRKQVCIYLEDMPHLDGFLSFDSSWEAMLVVFIVMLQQDFSPIQLATVDAFGDIAGMCMCMLSRWPMVSFVASLFV